jgi:hypothetical protein
MRGELKGETKEESVLGSSLNKDLGFMLPNLKVHLLRKNRVIEASPESI